MVKTRNQTINVKYYCSLASFQDSAELRRNVAWIELIMWPTEPKTNETDYLEYL